MTSPKLINMQFHYFLGFLIFKFLYKFLAFDYDETWCRFLLVSCVGVYWASWIYGFIIVHQFGKCPAIISSNVFSACSLPLGTPITNTLSNWSCPIVYWCFVHFFKKNLLFPGCFIWIVFIAMLSSSLIFSSVISTLPLYPCSVFFISHVVVSFSSSSM